jgi:hypothetical protein
MAKAIRTCKPRGSLVPLSAQPSYIKVHGLLLQFISLFKFFFFFFFFFTFWGARSHATFGCKVSEHDSRLNNYTVHMSRRHIQNDAPFLSHTHTTKDSSRAGDRGRYLRQHLILLKALMDVCISP